MRSSTEDLERFAVRTSSCSAAGRRVTTKDLHLIRLPAICTRLGHRLERDEKRPNPNTAAVASKDGLIVTIHHRHQPRRWKPVPGGRSGRHRWDCTRWTD